MIIKIAKHLNGCTYAIAVDCYLDPLLPNSVQYDEWEVLAGIDEDGEPFNLNFEQQKRLQEWMVGLEAYERVQVAYKEVL